jgi:hypothetical protein
MARAKDDPQERPDRETRVGIANAISEWLATLQARRDRPRAYDRALRGAWGKILWRPVDEFEELSARQALTQFCLSSETSRDQLFELVSRLWKEPCVNEGFLEDEVNRVLASRGSRYAFRNGVVFLDGRQPPMPRKRPGSASRPSIAQRTGVPERFTRLEKLNIRCPRCSEGRLTIGSSEDLVARQSGDSRADREHPGWSEENEWKRFAGMLSCDDGACGEIVAVAGEAHWESTIDTESKQTPVETYYPHFYLPAPNLVAISPRWPKAVAQELRKAFASFWSDESSCANHIRTTVELLLDQQRVRRTQLTTNRRRQRLTLHARITLYRTRHPNEAHKLLAVKWIGNEGSHAGETLTRHNLCDGFELIEDVLRELFDRPDNQKRLMGMAKKIAKRRGR